MREHNLNYPSNIEFEFGKINPSLDGRGMGRVVPLTKQTHSTKIHFLDSVDPDHTYIGDAFFTSTPGIVCLVRTADCLPILVYDNVKMIVGAVHCGWRGTAAHIIKKSISFLKEKGSRPEDIVALLGPHIRQDCYQVGEDLIEEFEKNGWDISKIIKEKEDKMYLSLTKAALIELNESGVKQDNIRVIKECTFCNKEYNSYRRNPENKERNINYIVRR